MSKLYADMFDAYSFVWWGDRGPHNAPADEVRKKTGLTTTRDLLKEMGYDREAQ